MMDISYFLSSIISGLVILLLFFFLQIILVKKHIKRIKKEEEEKHTLIIKHQKKLTRFGEEAQEKERKRIAANLHDDVMAQLHRIKLTNEEKKINEMLKKCISSVRYISHDLSPPMLEQTSIKALILDFIRPFQKKYSILYNHNSPSTPSLNETQKLHLFRLFQEVITNINKHAKATRIEILFRDTEKYVCLIVKDNGIGIPLEKNDKMGLKNIELRVQMLKGCYRLLPKNDAGTIFSVLISKTQTSEYP